MPAMLEGRMLSVAARLVRTDRPGQVRRQARRQAHRDAVIWRKVRSGLATLASACRRRGCLARAVAGGQA